MKKRILIAMTSHSEKGSTGEPTGAYLPEIAHPYEVFARAGLDVDFASVRGGRVPLDGASRDDAAVAAFLDEEGLEARLHASTPSERVDASLYDAVFFAGGHGTMWDFRGDSGFERVARDVYEKGGIVSAVCHGPAALVDVRLSDGRPLVEGKEVAAFTNEEEQAVGLTAVVPFLLADALVARGARHVAGAKWAPHVRVDGRLVTGQNPASARGVAEAVVVALGQPTSA
jgi:putative intracellular protease/amidase